MAFVNPSGAVDDRNIVRFRVAANAATEATRHPHQMSVVQGVIGPGQGLPPDMKSAAFLCILSGKRQLHAYRY
jgi:hypothetical protein